MSERITIVLLPGLNGTDGLFAPLIDCSNGEYDVVCMSYPTHQKLSYTQLQDFLLKKVKALNTPFVLVGESFSGPLSIMLEKAKPTGLIGIVLVATFIQAPNFRIGLFLPWHLGFLLAKPLYNIRALLSKKGNRGFIQAVSTELQKVAPEVLADRIQSTFSVNVTQELKECDIPIIYFRGKQDFVVPKKNLDLIIKTKPDVKVVYFNTQHFLLQSKPNEAWREIALFINNLLPIRI